MSIISKFFSNKAAIQQKQEPDNDKVVLLLNEWKETRSTSSAEAVLHELENGHNYLLLPVVNSPSNLTKWKTLNTDVTIKLKSVSNIDGFKVLAAFTDHDALKAYCADNTKVITILTKDLLKHCQINGIDKIIINKNSLTEFTLDRSNKNVKKEILKTGTEILIGPAAKALNPSLIEKLIAGFEHVKEIKEAYQYEMCRNNEYSIVIGVLLAPKTEKSEALLRNAVNNTLFEESLEGPLDIAILDNEELLSKVRDIANSLFYVSNIK